MRAEALDDLQHMRGEEDGSAARDHALQHGLEGVGGNGVHSLEGLIEKQHLRPVDDGGGERELLAHAVGVIRDELLRLIGEAHEVQQLGAALLGGGLVEAVHAADEVQVLGRGEFAEERHAFGHDADVALHLNRVREEVFAEDLDAA